LQPLRRWVPGPARAITVPEPEAPAAALAKLPALPALPAPASLDARDPDAKDMAFCAALAAHGGVAVSEDGFKAEGELVRLRRAGLLDLERGPEAPFAVIRVALTHKALALLSATRTQPANPPMALPDPAQARSQRCHGFEVARGMIGAAFKAELSAWRAQGEPGGAAGLELRMLTRIGRIEVPFAT
jgi:hypothetical protein